MDNEDYLNRLRALTNQQNVPLRIKPAEQPRIPQQYAPTYNAPTIPFTPQPAKPKPQAPFPQRAQSFITSAGSQLGGGLLRAGLRTAPTIARFSPVGLSSYAAGKLGGRDVIGELQKRGEELAKESERLQEQELARLPDQSAVRPGKLFGSGIKGVADVAALVAPSMLASKLLQGTQLVQRGLQAGPGVRLATKAAESVLSGLPASGVDVLQQIGRGEKPSAARSIAVGAAVDLGVPFLGEGIRIVRDSRIVQRLAETDSAQRIFNYLRRTAPEVEEQAARTAAEDIAKTTNPEEVATIVDDLIEQTPTKPTVPEPTPVPTPTPTSAVQAVTENLARQTDVNQIRQTVQELFPALDENGQLEFSQRIAAANTPEAVEAVLDQADEASRAITQAIEEATPPAPATTGTPIEQATEQPVTAPTRVSAGEMAPAPATTAPTTTQPAGVAEAAPATTVPGAAGAGGTPPTPPPGGQPKVSEVLYGTDSPSEEQGLDFIRRFSPNRLIREYVTRPAQDFVNRMFAKAQVSGVAPIRGLGRLGTGISRELGATPELLAARKQFLQGTGEFGKIVREDIVALGKGLSDTVQQRVWATLDPELAAAKGIKVSIADLQPEELAYRDELVKIRDAITQENLDRGLINEEQARANWFKRGYEVFDFEPEAKTAYQDTKRGLLKQFKGRKDISEELVEAAIEDPSYLLAKKAADSHAVWGMVDYGNWLAANDLVSDVARPGYRQLPTSKIYGEASGKFVPTNIAEDFTGFQFNNAITNAFNDVITAYDNLGVRKAKKAILTVLNPTVRLGNQLSNRVIFAQLGGINPFTFNKNFIRVKKLRASRDPLYLEAVKRGLTGLDMTQKEFTSKVAEYTGQPNLAQKAWEWAKGSYSQADDTARIAAFVTNVERGYSLDEAARLSQRAFQDYKSVGFLYDIAAKTPIVGNAFIRFAGDSARILTNALVDQPLTLAGSLTGLWALGEYMSRMSGETPDEKKTREERFGAPKVPFVNIPLEIQTPWGAVNAARFLPYYNLNEIQGNLTKFLPFAGNPLESKNWNDPLLGQALQILVDKDFRGKSIAEPENVGQFRTPTPSDVALENRVRFALTQNVPLGREIDALYSAAKGQEDVYGGERSLGQAIGRLFGVKVEKFGPEQVNKLKENEAFFADKKFIDDQLATMPKDLQEKYKKLTGYYKLRDQVENTFAKGKMRFKKEPVFAFPEDKYKELSSAPELYDLLMQQKIRDNQRDGKPIPPEFDIRLSNEFRRQLIENKSLRPGEDLEADERMFTNPEWDTYQAIKKEYTAKAKEFYPQTSGEFNDELVKHQNADFPEKGGAYKEYSDAYALFAKGQGPKPTFTDAVAVDKEKYNQAKLDWVNKERKARGLAPISPEVWNNVTFGFTSDEEKVYNELRYGKGLGGFGFSSTSPDYKAAMAALKRAGITVKPLEIISAAPRRVKLQRVRVPTTRRAARIRLR